MLACPVILTPKRPRKGGHKGKPTKGYRVRFCEKEIEIFAPI